MYHRKRKRVKKSKHIAELRFLILKVKNLKNGERNKENLQEVDGNIG